MYVVETHWTVPVDETHEVVIHVVETHWTATVGETH